MMFLLASQFNKIWHITCWSDIITKGGQAKFVCISVSLSQEQPVIES